MAGGFFETVAEAQRRARRQLPKSVYMALVAGSESGRTVKDNVEAFGELGFAPHVAGLASERDLATTIMGQEISLPVVISPGGRAGSPSRRRGGGGPCRRRARHGGRPELVWQQARSRRWSPPTPRRSFRCTGPATAEQITERLARAKAAGAAGLIVTFDWSFSYGRDWGSPAIPEQMDFKAALRLAPEAIVRPRWLLLWAKTRTLPDLTVPNMAVGGGTPPTFFGAYGQWMQTSPPTWDDLRWLREQWQGPLMLKGVMRIDDALRAVDAGFTAISVSNHGGNNLDGTPAPIRALPTIAEAVGDQIEVLLDGGIRRGSDVVKAVALGARAVMIGRAYLWGLAANGQAGVENVLDVLRMGIESALMGLGRSSVKELSPADLLIPSGFIRRLGAPAESR